MVFGSYVYYDRIRNNSEKLEKKQSAPNLLVFVKKLFSGISNFFSYSKNDKDESFDLEKYYEDFKQKIQFYDSPYDTSVPKFEDVLRRAKSRIFELQRQSQEICSRNFTINTQESFSLDSSKKITLSSFRTLQHEPNAKNTIKEIKTSIAFLKKKRKEAVQNVEEKLKIAIQNNKISKNKPLTLKLVPENSDKSSLLITSWVADYITSNYRILVVDGRCKLVLRPQKSDYENSTQFSDKQKYRKIEINIEHIKS